MELQSGPTGDHVGTKRPLVTERCSLGYLLQLAEGKRQGKKQCKGQRQSTQTGQVLWVGSEEGQRALSPEKDCAKVFVALT